MQKIISGATLFIALVLAQVSICNNILLFGVATPIVIIYFIIRMRVGLNINWAMTLAFAIGLVTDIFSDTLGMNSLCCTILSVLRKPVLLAYMQRDDSLGEIIPTLGTLGILTYGKYLLSMVLIYCIMLFGIEYFSPLRIVDIIVAALSSTLLTFLILLAVDSLMTNRHEKRF